MHWKIKNKRATLFYCFYFRSQLNIIITAECFWIIAIVLFVKQFFNSFLLRILLNYFKRSVKKTYLLEINIKFRVDRNTFILEINIKLRVDINTLILAKNILTKTIVTTKWVFSKAYGYVVFSVL